MRSEIQRRQSNTEKVLAYLLAHPREWVSTATLEQLGGRQAWRSRVSDARKIVERQHGGTIENRQQHAKDGIVSEYRYLPYQPLGPDAATKRTKEQQASLFR